MSMSFLFSAPILGWQTLVEIKGSVFSQTVICLKKYIIVQTLFKGVSL